MAQLTAATISVYQAPSTSPRSGEFFGAAWSACYMGALELAANNKHVKLPPEVAVDAEIDLNNEGGWPVLSPANLTLACLASTVRSPRS